jgi:hypothetical protein
MDDNTIFKPEAGESIWAFCKRLVLATAGGCSVTGIFNDVSIVVSPGDSLRVAVVQYNAVQRERDRVRMDKSHGN